MKGHRCDICGHFTAEGQRRNGTSTILFREPVGALMIDLCPVCTSVLARILGCYRWGKLISQDDLEYLDAHSKEMEPIKNKQIEVKSHDL